MYKAKAEDDSSFSEDDQGRFPPCPPSYLTKAISLSLVATHMRGESSPLNLYPMDESFTGTPRALLIR